MTGLRHMDINPVIVFKKIRRAFTALGMKGEEMFAAIALFQPGCHAAYDIVILLFFHIAITTHYPDDGFIFVAPAKVFAENTCILRCKDLWPCASFSIPFIPPGWQHGHDQSQFGSFVYNIIYMLKIGFIGFGGIVIDQWCIAISVWGMQSIQFGQYNGLDNGEAFGSAVG